MSRPHANASSAPGRPSPEPCRVWIVEDQDEIREFLETFIAALPGFQAIGASEGTNPALIAAAQGRIDLVILDLMLPDEGGMSALEKFSRLPTVPKILIYTASVTAHSVQMAIRHGALGYVEKTDPLSEFHAALERVRTGGMHISPRASRMLSALVQPGVASERRPEPLECRMLELLAQGSTLKAVAHDLGISYPKAHRIRQLLMERAQIKRPEDLATYAIEIGLLGNKQGTDRP